MVDLGFLLITFFVFTTSMAESKAMNLMETREGAYMPVKESCAMTIILSKNHEIFYYYGSPDNCPPNQTGILDINYGGWEDNYEQYREILESRLIINDIDYINNPIPVLIINDNFEVK